MKLILTKALAENHFSLSDENVSRLTLYLELLIKWNRVFNLTAITKPKEMVYLHVVDSLMISPYLFGQRCLDVGTGAGLPGIPLAIMHPDLHWTLLDKCSKKTRFLQQVVAELGLKNVEVIHARTEDYHPALTFDTIVSRAFGALDAFILTSKHLISREGHWLAMKGKIPHEELKSAEKEATLIQTARLEINGMHVERHVLCFKHHS